VTRAIIPGCEPLSIHGSPTGVLVLHGFTGSPDSMRPLAEQLANAGFSVELPLLPGHGTDVEDMLITGFADWSAASETAYRELAVRCDRVVVAGLSMGGTLSCWLAEQHPEIVGLILVNPLVEHPGPEMVDGLQTLLDGGMALLDGIGSDIAKEGSAEASYDATPVAPLLSLYEAVEEISADLGRISCPVLVFTSVEDHVVPSSHSAHVLATVSGPSEQVLLEHSYHVATLDNDAPLIEAEAVAFVERLAAEAGA
jgi:carboxylesterase